MLVSLGKIGSLTDPYGPTSLLGHASAFVEHFGFVNHWL